MSLLLPMCYAYFVERFYLSKIRAVFFSPFLPLFLFPPQSDLTIPFLLCPPIFPSVSPNFLPPKFVLSPCYPPRSMLDARLKFTFLWLSCYHFFPPIPPPWGSCSRVTKVRILPCVSFLLYTPWAGLLRKVPPYFPSPSQVFSPALSFLCLFLPFDRAAKLNYVSLRTVCVLLVLFLLSSWIGLFGYSR